MRFTRRLYGLRCFGTGSLFRKHLPNWRRRERIRQKSASVVLSNSAPSPDVPVAAIAPIAGITSESSRSTKSTNSPIRWERYRKGQSVTLDQKKLVALLEKKKADGQWQPKSESSVVAQSSPKRVVPVGPEIATSVVHVRKAPFDVYIGRDFLEFRGIGWGNPFKIEPGCGWKCVLEKYEAYVRSRTDLMARLPELRGKALGCWCKPRKHCHGDVLVKLVNETLRDE